MDIIADLSVLQSAINDAKVEHLLLGNRVRNRARNAWDCFSNPWTTRSSFRSLASFATKRTSYALLGVLVMITSASCDASQRHCSPPSWKRKPCQKDQPLDLPRREPSH
eukprot:5174013-Amphidinium_carterae.1